MIFLSPSRRAKLLQVLRDPERKSLPRIAWEAASFRREKRTSTRQYVDQLLYRKHIYRPNLHLGKNECKIIWNALSEHGLAPVLHNKISFYKEFGHLGSVRLPRHLGWTDPNTFIFADGSQHSLSQAGDLELVLSQMLDDVRAGSGDSVFAKPSLGLKGSGIYRLSSAAPPPSLWAAVQAEGYVFQQTVEQHPALAAVAPDTLNTLRITTLRRGSDEPEVVGAWIRFGRRGAVVDNASAGGLFNGVDLVTGRLPGPSMTKFEQGGRLYTHHPDTGHPLVGFEVPAFEACLEMALAAARHIAFPLIGWDVAVTPDGPVVIEGNSRSNYMSDQTANGVGYLAHPSLGPFVREILKQEKAASVASAAS